MPTGSQRPYTRKEKAAAGRKRGNTAAANLLSRAERTQGSRISDDAGVKKLRKSIGKDNATNAKRSIKQTKRSTAAKKKELAQAKAAGAAKRPSKSKLSTAGKNSRANAKAKNLVHRLSGRQK